jgi:hypothetical protein
VPRSGKAVAAACIAIGGLIGYAHGEIVELSYTEQVKTWTRLLQEVSEARGLDESTASLAERTATAWFYMGPCRGSTHNLDEINPTSTFSIVSLAKPSRPFEAAVLEMIAVMARENLGREPGDDMCRFALETAVPYR